jgi:hypothetical protein
MYKTFKVAGKTYEIEVVEYLEDKELGHCNYLFQKVMLAEKWLGKEIHKESMEQTLFHEIFHAVLEEAGYSELSADERFVQGISLLIHQVFKTLK